ncbi:hypothetical protein D3C71_1411380 [compost metagenome]
MRIIGVAVDELEAVELVVGGGHQFDDAGGGMAGDARALVEFLPSQKIRQHVVEQFGVHLLRALQGHDVGHVRRREQCRHIFLPKLWKGNSGRCPNQFIVTTFHTKR